MLNDSRRVLSKRFLKLYIWILVCHIGSNNIEGGGAPDTVYDGYQIIQVQGLQGFKNGEDVLRNFDVQDEEDVEILHGNKLEGTAQLLVSPKFKNKLFEKLKGRYDFEVFVEDLGKNMKNENQLIRYFEPPFFKKAPNFLNYLRLKKIEEHLFDLKDSYPDQVILKKIGESFEERDIYMIIISDDLDDIWASESSERPVIFVEAGIHAREWISPISTIYLINKILQTPSLLRTIEFRIVVVTNPDGYVYSWEKLRLWRKNRADIYHHSCIGVDLNRNFASHFKETKTRKCKSDYSGPSPFSEPESEAIKDAVWYIRDRIQAYMSVHSYGQLILIPPGAEGKDLKMPPAESRRLKKLGTIMADEIRRVQKVNYTVGSPIDILYSAHGISQDWAYFEAKIPYVFTMELRDTGKEGFLLSPHRIISAAEDLWIGIQMLAGQVVTKNMFSFRNE